jgi:starch synthase
VPAAEAPDARAVADQPPVPSGRAPRFHILMVASEATPWAKTGGLADVVGALPAALDRLGHHVTTVLPRYRSVHVPESATHDRPVRIGSLDIQTRFHVITESPRRRVVFVDVPRYFDRPGLYGDASGDYPDNAERFALLSTAALDFAQHDAAGRRVDVVHAHDWQGGLAPTLLATWPGRWPALSSAGRVFTIHNLAYQGLFPRDMVPALGLPREVFHIDRGEFWGKFSVLKAGINDSDEITTVSPTYARETQTRAFGSGLEGVLAARADRYTGILNGIDADVWNPATDRFLPARYDAGDLTGKRICKRVLLERFHLPVGDDALHRPLMGMVSRLVDQKGLDLFEAAAPSLVELDATGVFLGSGESRYEALLRRLAAAHPVRVGVHIGFDEPLSHLIEAGSDMFLMPSRFEPCGLNQMYSLRYGTVPIVHAVGGLDDTIQPYTARARRANGFKFHEPTPEALVRTVRQAVRLYRDRHAWQRLMLQGMTEDHSWAPPAKEYVKVYRRARLHGSARAAV